MQALSYRRAPGLAVSMPPPEDVERWAKAAGAVATALAALWVPYRAIRRRLRARYERRREQDRTIRYLADAVHVLLRERVRRPMPDGDRWKPGEDDLAQQAVRIYEQRNALFRADGHEPPARVTGQPLTEAEVLVLIRRTQAIKDMQDREASPPGGEHE